MKDNPLPISIEPPLESPAGYYIACQDESWSAKIYGAEINFNEISELQAVEINLDYWKLRGELANLNYVHVADVTAPCALCEWASIKQMSRALNCLSCPVQTRGRYHCTHFTEPLSSAEYHHDLYRIRKALDLILEGLIQLCDLVKNDKERP